ncbi:hypothetical protein L1987_14377 [Smallanthus sonchifolius]|uniref:Uncharacterized protein n=1 Tax=Smallanthus sonchifolius TaxID=185202 RepID=A0ACB9J2Q2_9ASTR|nr:hypothetical protein L1987_14377 [Smallanthus sonchifolius]
MYTRSPVLQMMMLQIQKKVHSDLVSPKTDPCGSSLKKDMVITLNQELVVAGDKTIDGRGAKVEITGGGLTLMDVNNVIIHGINIHDVKVLVRADAPEAESMKWNWRTEKDVLENGAIFLASGTDPTLTPEHQRLHDSS